MWWPQFPFRTRFWTWGKACSVPSLQAHWAWTGKATAVQALVPLPYTPIEMCPVSLPGGSRKRNAEVLSTLPTLLAPGSQLHVRCWDHQVFFHVGIWTVVGLQSLLVTITLKMFVTVFYTSYAIQKEFVIISCHRNHLLDAESSIFPNSWLICRGKTSQCARDGASTALHQLLLEERGRTAAVVLWMVWKPTSAQDLQWLLSWRLEQMYGKGIWS